MAAASLDDILDDLNDYSDYEELDSLARAKTFLTAARRFLQIPSSQSHNSASHAYNQASVQEMVRHARLFIAQKQSQAASGGVRNLGIGSDFRR
jgi:hypothetical protein